MPATFATKTKFICSTIGAALKFRSSSRPTADLIADSSKRSRVFGFLIYASLTTCSFDAVKIALTATPALHTTEIFGKPIFKYTCREAVFDGYLVDHDSPHRLKTQLSESGIHYKRGETVTTCDTATGKLVSELLADEPDFDIDNFNRQDDAVQKITGNIGDKKFAA